MILNILLVALGGAMGSTARYLISEALKGWVPAWPMLGTLAVNLVGCFFIGLISSVDRGEAWPATRLMLTTGAMGGFTTFSTFSLDAVKAMQSNQGTIAFAYLTISVLGGLVGCFAGLSLGKNL